MIILDGSEGEGGGQIIRTALALSSLTGQPFRAKNIRAGRKDAGLKAQHVHAIKALQTLCNAKADGVEIGSQELLYIPGKINAKNHTIDIETAGSITLLLQAVLLPCIFGNKTHTLTIKGGTDVQWSMPIDYFTNVLIPQYRRYAQIEVKLLKRGYYPKGGGEVEITIKPEIKRNEFETFEAFTAMLTHKAIKLEEQGTLMTIKGISHASTNLQEARAAERQADAAKQALSHLNVPIEITSSYSETLSTGSVITIWAIYSTNTNDIDIHNPIRLGADALGEPHKPAEQVGREAANKLLEEIKNKSPVDSHTADNLVPLMAISKPSTIKTTKITSHTKTNINTSEKFVGNIFEIKENTIMSKKLSQ